MYNSTLGRNSLISICPSWGSSRFCCCFLSITAVYSITDPRDLQQPTLMCLEKLTVKSPNRDNICDTDFIYWDVIKMLSVRETILKSSDIGVKYPCNNEHLMARTRQIDTLLTNNISQMIIWPYKILYQLFTLLAPHTGSYTVPADIEYAKLILHTI